MVKAFSDREKEIIKAKLLEKGRQYFGIYGLKKTSIADLTKEAGIAQGSFYIFFNSKEELYFEILQTEEEVIRRRLLTGTLSIPQVTKEVFKEFLKTAIEMVEANPIIRRLYMEGEYEVLLRRLPPERMGEYIEKDVDVLRPLIEKWQKEGAIIQKRPEVIAGVLRSFFTISLHKKEIGEEFYDETLDLLSDFIAEGLVRKEEGF